MKAPLPILPLETPQLLSLPAGRVGPLWGRGHSRGEVTGKLN